MSKEKIFRELIAAMAGDGEISPSEYAILLEKGKDIGLDKTVVDLLIKMELSDSAAEDFPYGSAYDSDDSTETENYDFDDSNEKAAGHRHKFRAAITRGGGVLTPDVLIIDDESIIYRKRNKYLINTDTLTIPLSKVSSVKIDTSLLGTDIIITTFGSGEIIARKFSKSDAKEIRKLILERIKK